MDELRSCAGGDLEVDKRYEHRKQQSGLRFGIIEVTSACQCACPGCYMVRRNALNKGKMTLRQDIEILDLCRRYTGRELETMDILGGEPLLWPNLKDYIEVLLKKKIAPWVFTNMLALTKELAEWLFARKIHITGKLNIADFSDSEQLTLQAKMIGRDVSLAAKMKEQIDLLLNVGYRAPLLRLQNLIRKNNIHLVPAYYRFCLEKNVGVDIELMGSGETIGPKYWETAPSPSEIAKMVINVQRVREEFGLAPAKVLMPHVFGSCPFYDKGLYFAVNGTIRACSNSPIVLTKINDPDPIKKAWESPLLCHRREISQQVIGEPCKSCHKWQECRGGCRATAEGLGDSFKGYELCPVPYFG